MVGENERGKRLRRILFLSQPQAADKGGKQAAQRHRQIADGQGLEARLHIKAHAVGVDPEIAVVDVAAQTGTRTGSQEDKDGVEAEAGCNGSAERCRRRHCDRAGALHDFQQAGDDKGNEDEGQTGVQHHLCQTVACAGNFKYLAQCAARCGDEHDGAGVLQGLVHDVDDGLAAQTLAQGDDGQDCADGQSNVWNHQRRKRWTG